jgi:hypothetical protein
MESEDNKDNPIYNFTGKEFSLKSSITDEQLLDLALENIASVVEGEEPNKIAGRIVVTYVCEQFRKEGKNCFTREEISERCDSLVLDHVLETLSQKGMIDVNVDESGSFSYSITEKGKNVAITLGDNIL